LDAENNHTAVFIFCSPGTLSTTQDMKVVLSNSANPNNIYWSAGTAATFAQYAIIEGNIFAGTGITYAAGCTHHGRYDDHYSRICFLFSSGTMGSKNIP